MGVGHATTVKGEGRRREIRLQLVDASYLSLSVLGAGNQRDRFAATSRPPFINGFLYVGWFE
jgi:hypothetical protein